MADKVKLNKNSLREQKQALALFQEFLPTLELRKQQLQMEVRELRKVVEDKRSKMHIHLDSAQQWANLISSTVDEMRHIVRVKEIVTHRGNVAGVRVPVFDRVEFEPVQYSLVATDPAFDDMVSFWLKALSLREELAVLERQLVLLDRELVKTTQRINLYEKVLIPEAKEHIRRIKVYLGDQQTAAVCRAKMAKEKIVRKTAAMARSFAASA
ncbi:MAG: V-type ATP synthase subunit D [Deltaproteobacteria bacterium]|nr:V-type ATP synthase subunit D [Deltaproteobacteria bacterium]